MAISVALDPNNTAARNKEELVKALSSFQTRGGSIRLPRSAVPFPIDPGIVWPAQRNLELIGDGPAAGYEDSFAATELKFTTGNVGIDLSQINVNDPATPYAVISGISLNGNDVCAQGLKCGGIMSILDLNATKFTQAGVHLAKLINTANIGRLSVIGNGNIGLWIGGEGETSNPNNTRLTIDELISRSNLVGVRWEQAQGATIRSGVIESNYHEGMQFYRPANRVLENILLERVWFEANWRGELGYAITFDGNGVSPTNVIFNGVHISVGGQSKAINAIRLADSKFENMDGSGVVLLGTNCTNTKMLDIPSTFTITDSGTNNYIGSSIGTGSGGGSGGSSQELVEVSLGDSNATLTAGQVVNTVIEIAPTVNRTLTMPSASAIITEMGGFVQGAAAEFTIMNRSPNTGTKVQLLGGTGTTLKGNNELEIGSGLFGIVLNSFTTVTVFNKSIK